MPFTSLLSLLWLPLGGCHVRLYFPALTPLLNAHFYAPLPEDIVEETVFHWNTLKITHRLRGTRGSETLQLTKK
ncbi:hypothetical protein BJY52DRAFT_1319979 [Lactarius psammicola]|nr:hypothetical protein BJY52DRAFT_1319979 [Lactarius psammicola]